MNLTFEVTNIFITWIGKNIRIMGYFQLVLSMSFAFFPQPVQIGTDSLAISAAAEDCFQLVPIYELKVKLERR